MRRIYESDALRRGDAPHEPADGDGGRGERITGNRHRSSVDWAAASHALVPTALRDRAIEVSVETDRDAYAPGDPVSIRVRMRNRLPVPIALRTPTPVRWAWSVDGVRGASHVDECDPPARPALFAFHRGETKTFARTWRQAFRTDEREWEAAEPGVHEIAAFVDVADPESRGLFASVDVEIEA